MKLSLEVQTEDIDLLGVLEEQAEKVKYSPEKYFHWQICDEELRIFNNGFFLVNRVKKSLLHVKKLSKGKLFVPYSTPTKHLSLIRIKVKKVL